MKTRNQKSEARGRRSATRNPKPKTRNSQRACLRCGCTEDNACACVCSWVYGCDVCDACLTFEEKLLYTRLLSEFEVAEDPILEKRAQNRLNTFGKFLTQLIWDEPIRLEPVKKGAGK